MIEVEIQKLTAAIEALTKAVQESGRPTVVVNSETPTNLDNLRQADQSYRDDDAAREALQAERDRRQAELDQQLAEVYKAEQAKTKRKAKVTPEETKALVEAVAAPVAEPDDEPEVVSDLTENDLKTLAMEIARADSSARNIILSILGEHGSKTITHLDPKHYRAVHGRLMTLAHDIAKEGAPF
jgi:23S rRNA pseudoU1915 N3-methylase RlmH